MMNAHQRKEMVLLLMDLLLVIVDGLIFRWIWNNFYALRMYAPFWRRGHLAMYAIFMALYAWFGHVYGAFDLKTTRALIVFYSHVIASFMTAFIMFFIMWVTIRYVPAIPPLILGMVLWSLTGLIWAKPATWVCDKLYPPSRTAIIYDNEIAFKNGLAICHDVPRRFKVVATFPVDDNGTLVEELIKAKAEAVMLCGIHSSKRNDILKFCLNAGIPTYIRPNIGDFLLNSAENLQYANLPILLCQRSAQSPVYAFIKRLFDIVFALVFLIILSPLEIIIACIIHFYDKGPVFYKQTRLTKDGKMFQIYKFRSMKVDAEKDTGARLAAQNDDRITPVGKFIRATRIDELPQMINILKGEMSVVGPRPERPEIAMEYEKDIPEFSLRLQVKAGLTGYAQVHGKYNTSPYDKLQMDLMYIARQSVATDFIICLETFKILFMKESTDGVADGQTNAEDK